jgi:hypothetical protein
MKEVEANCEVSEGYMSGEEINDVNWELNKKLGRPCILYERLPWQLAHTHPSWVEMGRRLEKRKEDKRKERIKNTLGGFLDVLCMNLVCTQTTDVKMVVFRCPRVA